MRFHCALVSLVCAFSISAAAEAPETMRAEQEMARIKALVEAGALPLNRLQQADEALDDARDEAVLGRTLYGSITIEELTEQQADEMMAAAQRRVARQEARMERARQIVEMGGASKLSLAPLAEEHARRREVLGVAEVRARLFREIAAMARTEQLFEEEIAGAPRESLPLVERFDGAGVFHDGHLEKVSRAFAEQFSRPLPVSARGDTAAHRALGFDHRGRVDVAIDPDHEEGVWLRRFLERAGIPYYAFRSALPGRATAPHIHIGPPSGRLRGGG